MTEHSLWRFSRALHSALESRRTDELEAFLDDDVEWAIYGPIDMFAFLGARQGKQAVLETTAGTIVFDLLADAAPNHVAHFITRARGGAYDGTTFHRIIAMGIIQGGDPLSKDPAQASRYGTGGLGTLRFEANAEKNTRGAVSAVLVRGAFSVLRYRSQDRRDFLDRLTGSGSLFWLGV